MPVPPAAAAGAGGLENPDAVAVGPGFGWGGGEHLRGTRTGDGAADEEHEDREVAFHGTLPRYGATPTPFGPPTMLTDNVVRQHGLCQGPSEMEKEKQLRNVEEISGVGGLRGSRTAVGKASGV